MTKRRDFLRTLGAAGVAGVAAARAAPSPAPADVGDRAYWLGVLRRLSEPVLVNLAVQRLKETMPVEAVPGAADDRRNYAHLEAFGRLLAGVSPWLELEGEAGRLRERYADLARRSLDAATDPRSRDFMNFNTGGQPVVDAAFLAQAILRAPRELWQKLDARVRANVVAALKATRVIKPHYSN